MHALLIKMSSMGDLLHVLPAITDASKAVPGLTFDWVIEENFSEIASWHPAIRSIIPSAHRRWRKNIFKTFFSGEFSLFYQTLRSTKYDMVLDGQTNFKSALISLLSRGLRVGLDKYSVREYVAHFAYQKKYNVTRKQHAIEILRHFFAKAFDYEHPGTAPDYGIDPTIFEAEKLDMPDKYLVFIHAASWKTKLWPEEFFTKLVQFAEEENIPVFLPWGTLDERDRAKRIVKNCKNGVVLPKMSLSTLARVLVRSTGAVCVDTGLSHLAAALDVPSVNLYGPTDPNLVGAIGPKQIQLTSGFACSPCNKGKCAFTGQGSVFPACFSYLTPKKVWSSVSENLLARLVLLNKLS